MAKDDKDGHGLRYGFSEKKHPEDVSFLKVQVWLENRGAFANMLCSLYILPKNAFSNLFRANKVLITYNNIIITLFLLRYIQKLYIALQSNKYLTNNSTKTKKSIESKSKKISFQSRFKNIN